mmetsp:Transcript_63216/g.148465  ORF Transcript_63216/g.148465 Transcript_63216/m.148465 type:complete len:324 (-) Transcript_63216:269-1240(-)
MSLRSVLCFGFAAGAAAYARTSLFATPQELTAVSMKDWVDAQKASDTSLGALEMAGSCCGDYSDASTDFQMQVNTNQIAGSTKDVEKQIFGLKGCSKVEKMDSFGSKGCNYFFVFENKDYVENTYAANCVPATTCNQDVVGMTKGMIATYGVVLQILQPNLGDLSLISSGPTDACYKAMNKINMGNIKDLTVMEPIKLGPITVGHKEKFVVDGMDKVDTVGSLGKCADKDDIGYLYIHKNLYWSQDKGAVDIASFVKAEEEKSEAKKKQAEAEAIKAFEETAAEKVEAAKKEGAKKEPAPKKAAAKKEPAAKAEKRRLSEMMV